ncbi:hypothetical protein F2Q69_00014061 [Brassica cretica]|uniref:Uncharacterized protein n=1 Tax=Brassica cretica TaxID=69181 RepID=A0A8S9QUP6_BRACR|nr:hypothetical protein F2Q69_00014061 [Brassica cretica]
MYMSKASHLAVPKHQRTPIWTEEAAGFHKRVKRIHDPRKTVVPCTVFEAESPIPPDRSMQISSYIEVLDDHQHVEASQRGLRFRYEVDKGPAEAASIDTDRIQSNHTNKLESTDATTSPSINTERVSSRRSLMCVEILGMEIPPRDQTSAGKEEEELEEEKKDQGRSSGIIDPSLLRWCQEIQSAQQMLLTTICKASSAPYC